MEFSHQTRGAMAQVFGILSNETVQVFIYKHLGSIGLNLPPPFVVIAEASPQIIRAMLLELLSANKALRNGAPIKNVFDNSIDELRRWALHDGWIVEGTALVRVTPMAETITGLRDKLTEDLAVSGLDPDGAIRAALNESSKNFVAHSPDFNGSITHARIALETVARRAAQRIAKERGATYPDDSWGKALALLKAETVIEKVEEDILARVYTFVSDGAHVPKGISAEEWARLARTFSVCSTYFLLRKAAAA
jgi:hypothetical protein